MRSGTWVIITDLVKEGSVGRGERSQKAGGQGSNEHKDVVTAGGFLYPVTHLRGEGESVEDALRRETQCRRLEQSDLLRTGL